MATFKAVTCTESRLLHCQRVEVKFELFLRRHPVQNYTFLPPLYFTFICHFTFIVHIDFYVTFSAKL